MSRRLIGVVVFSGLASVGSATELPPASFAFGMPVVTPADAAAYRVSLPIGVYQGVAREDLGDIRVFNARGEVVPYAVSRPSARTPARGPGTALLTSVVAELADGRLEAERSSLEIAGPASGVAQGEYEFDLGARLPIERVNLGLPEHNTVAAVELLSRMHPRDPWRHIAARQFYRVSSADGELSNAPIDIATDSDRYWLARAVGSNGTGTAQPVRLQVTWTPSEIVFLARGSGPYLLAYGSTAAPPAETDLSSIPTAVTVLRATLGARRELGGQARLAKPAVEFPWKRLLLWAVLALSVCLLAWMAYRLSKEIGGRVPG
jgi:hypothetical protein